MSSCPGIVVGLPADRAGGGDPDAAGRGRRGVVAVVLIELVKRAGQVEPGAAMGVVFTTLFAAGVLLLEQSDTSSVHLDVEHALMGNLETLIWLRPRAGGRSLDPAALAALPPELARMALAWWSWSC
jgi:manganese/zinc/iron transport system permease protein